MATEPDFSIFSFAGYILFIALLIWLINSQRKWKIQIVLPALFMMFGAAAWVASNIGLIIFDSFWSFLFYSLLPILAGSLILIILVNRAKKDASSQRQKTADYPGEDVPKTQPFKDEISTEHEKEARERNAANIFISYRRTDSPNITGRIYDRLRQEYGKEAVFKDVDSIPLGVDFREHIDKMVGECNVLLAVIGNQWSNVKNDQGQRRIDDPLDFVRLEIEAALRREIPVIPLLVQGASMPVADELPAPLQALAYRNGIPVRPDPDFHNDMNRLLRGLEEYGSKSR